MLHTHYNQNMRKEEAVRFWDILPPPLDIDLVHPGHRPKRDQFYVIA